MATACVGDDEYMELILHLIEGGEVEGENFEREIESSVNELNETHEKFICDAMQ